MPSCSFCSALFEFTDTYCGTCGVQVQQTDNYGRVVPITSYGVPYTMALMQKDKTYAPLFHVQDQNVEPVVKKGQVQLIDKFLCENCNTIAIKVNGDRMGGQYWDKIEIYEQW